MDKKSKHNKVYETIKCGLEDAINGRVVEHHSVSCWADTPIVEYAPVVRCKDCKWWNTDFLPQDCGWCEKDNHGRLADWFCADGERRRE